MIVLLLPECDFVYMWVNASIIITYSSDFRIAVVSDVLSMTHLMSDYRIWQMHL